MKLLLLATALAVAGCAHRAEVRTACYTPGQDPAHYATFDQAWGPEIRTRPGYLDAVTRQQAGDCSAVYRFLRGVTLDSERATYGDDWERIKLERYIRAHLPPDIYDY